MSNRAIPILCAFLPLFVHAQNSAPEVLPMVDPIPPARDVAWPGVITLSVDASDVTRGVFHVTETIPVAAAGPLTLLYPKWLPGNHSDSGPISQLAGLKLNAGGRPLPWSRDPIDVFAFHINVLEGTASVEAQFQFLGPTDADQGRIVTTPGHGPVGKGAKQAPLAVHPQIAGGPDCGCADDDWISRQDKY